MDLITIENGSLVTHLEELSKEAEERANKVKALAVTKDNCNSLAEIRTKNNAFVKTVKESIEIAKEKYLEPFAKVESEALACLKPLELANKEFANAISEAQKAKKLEGMERYYRSLIAPRDDGTMPYETMPTFAEISKDIPLSLAKGRLEEAVKDRLESYQKTSADVMLVGSKANIEKMKAYARLLNVEWEEN